MHSAALSSLVCKVGVGSALPIIAVNNVISSLSCERARASGRRKCLHAKVPAKASSRFVCATNVAHCDVSAALMPAMSPSNGIAPRILCFCSSDSSARKNERRADMQIHFTPD